MKEITLKLEAEFRHAGGLQGQGFKVRVAQRFRVRATLTRDQETYHHG